MKVFTLLECVDETLVSGQVSHDAHLDLRVIRCKQGGRGLLSDKRCANFVAHLGPHRNVLQVGFERREPPCTGPGLIKSGVNPTIRLDGLSQALHDLPQLRRITMG